MVSSSEGPINRVMTATYRSRTTRRTSRCWRGVGGKFPRLSFFFFFSQRDGRKVSRGGSSYLSYPKDEITLKSSRRASPSPPPPPPFGARKKPNTGKGQSTVGCVLSVGVCTMWGALRAGGEELKMSATESEREREPVGTEQRRSVSLHFPISPPAASIRVEPPPPPTLHPPLPVVSQSASSGACDVTVQSNFVWANQGMLPSPKRERERERESAGLTQTRPESGRRSDGREKTRDNWSAERRTKTSRNVEWETS